MCILLSCTQVSQNVANKLKGSFSTSFIASHEYEIYKTLKIFRYWHLLLAALLFSSVVAFPLIRKFCIHTSPMKLELSYKVIASKKLPEAIKLDFTAWNISFYSCCGQSVLVQN